MKQKSSITYLPVIPLSFAQKRLWFLDQFEPGSSVYNIPMVKYINLYNFKALELSILQIIKRHEILRTIFINNTINRQGEGREREGEGEEEGEG